MDEEMMEYEPQSKPIVVPEPTPIGAIELPCGCTVVVDHQSGERRVTCGGGGRVQIDGEPFPCPGGRGYVVKAEAGPPIYEVLPVQPAPGQGGQ